MKTRKELHKELSEALVTHQEAFDKLKRFDLNLLRPNVITDIIGTITAREELERQERTSYENWQAAWNAYKACLESA